MPGLVAGPRSTAGLPPSAWWSFRSSSRCRPTRRTSYCRIGSQSPACDRGQGGELGRFMMRCAGTSTNKLACCRSPSSRTWRRSPRHPNTWRDRKNRHGVPGDPGEHWVGPSTIRSRCWWATGATIQLPGRSSPPKRGAARLPVQPVGRRPHRPQPRRRLRTAHRALVRVDAGDRHRAHRRSVRGSRQRPPAGRTGQPGGGSPRTCRNLTLAGPRVNRHQKRDHHAGGWLPPTNCCWFAAHVIDMKRAYGLTVDRRERDALARTLAGCADTDITPRGTVAAASAPASCGTAGASSGTDALALYDDNGNGRITCAEANRHGIAPMLRTHSAYRYTRAGTAMAWPASRSRYGQRAEAPDPGSSGGSRIQTRSCAPAGSPARASRRGFPRLPQRRPRGTGPQR